ncbi:flagellar hook-associated protein FlgL [Symmachiella macrocystis]|uniref:Flagellar hook-associated protein FlgL n=1 Tax=Symmachiella macrocystis TaxID=2527985 RepID=A0A5C6BHZ7_9PLAN|nr:flagellin [Symmachiella macrocystis]TWU11600.1 flagellar hook-associated protein FlgL [Symmachiella macrocystis]
MSLGPILSGRIPNGMVASRLNSNIQEQTRMLAQLQEQISSGVRFQFASESPAAAVRTITLQKTLELQAQNQTNVQTSSSLLSASDQGLVTVSDALNQAKGLIVAGIGDSSTQSERDAMALEAASLKTQVLNAANTQFRGRFLFGGTATDSPPFTSQDTFVRYNGDQFNINSYADNNLLIANNLDGHSALGALTEPVGTDIDPVLTLDTRISNLQGGQGANLGELTITLDNTPETVTVDLSSAKTIQDVQAILENAFAGQPTTLTVAINASQDGLELTPSAGNIEVTEVGGGTTAAHLGIVSGPAASVTGGDLDPAITLGTNLADLNGGAGIGATAGNGLLITNGYKTQVVDISAAVTVEDLLNTLELADLDLDVGINESGTGLAISSRLSGAGFSIGENGGQNATNLGIRTTLSSTLLEDFNFGQGVPVDDGIPLEIQRRDGTTSSIDLAGARTVQDVLDALNAEPNLTATLNAVGNGITIDDTSIGGNPLTIENTPLAEALGVVGTEATGPGTPLVGTDTNQREVQGSLTILSKLETALLNGDDQELQRLNEMLDGELRRVNLARGAVGSRLKVLDEVGNRLADQEVQIRETLSKEYEVDIAEVITNIAQLQTYMQASYQISASTLQLNLFSYI